MAVLQKAPSHLEPILSRLLTSARDRRKGGITVAEDAQKSDPGSK
jgi:hypothetical protein